MGGKDSNYKVVYRGEILPRYVPGELVLFQRPKESGGGFWLGRTCHGVFKFEHPWPISLSDALLMIMKLTSESKEHTAEEPDDQLSLF